MPTILVSLLFVAPFLFASPNEPAAIPTKTLTWNQVLGTVCERVKSSGVIQSLAEQADEFQERFKEGDLKTYQGTLKALADLEATFVPLARAAATETNRLVRIQDQFSEKISGIDEIQNELFGRWFKDTAIRREEEGGEKLTAHWSSRSGTYQIEFWKSTFAFELRKIRGETIAESKYAVRNVASVLRKEFSKDGFASWPDGTAFSSKDFTLGFGVTLKGKVGDNQYQLLFYNPKPQLTKKVASCESLVAETLHERFTSLNLSSVSDTPMWIPSRISRN